MTKEQMIKVICDKEERAHKAYRDYRRLYGPEDPYVMRLLYKWDELKDLCIALAI